MFSSDVLTIYIYMGSQTVLQWNGPKIELFWASFSPTLKFRAACCAEGVWFGSRWHEWVAMQHPNTTIWK
jgi:hypothetical protein